MAYHVVLNIKKHVFWDIEKDLREMANPYLLNKKKKKIKSVRMSLDKHVFGDGH